VIIGIEEDEGITCWVIFLCLLVLNNRAILLISASNKYIVQGIIAIHNNNYNYKKIKLKNNFVV